MKKPTITELAEKIGRSRVAVQNMKRDNQKMFYFLWKGYCFDLLEKELKKESPLKSKA